MPTPKFPHKPPAPSVRLTLGEAIARSRALSEERPLSRKDVVRDILAKLDLPEPLKRDLRERHQLDE